MTTTLTVPDFELPSTGNKTFKLSQHLNQTLIIYFYPKDATPGCTTQGQQFRDHYDEFKALNPSLNKPVILAAGTPQVLLPYDNAGRFVTDELKEAERTILDAEDSKDLLESATSDLGIPITERRFPKGDLLRAIVSFAANTGQTVDTVVGRDYPHPEGTWPNTLDWLRAAFAGVPESDARKILGENAIRCFGLDAPAIDAISPADWLARYQAPRE